MSSPNDSIYVPDSSSEDSRHFLIGVGVTVTFLILIVIMTVVAYFVGRRRGLAGVLVNPPEGGGEGSDVEKGLDEATLGAFPKLLFSSAGKSGGGGGAATYSTGSSCSVCLADYGEKEWLRVLPDCGHVFHLKCVDSWLRIHPTCPVCRKLPGSGGTSPQKS